MSQSERKMLWGKGKQCFLKKPSAGSGTQKPF
jgi:hypothetical protein